MTKAYYVIVDYLQVYHKESAVSLHYRCTQANAICTFRFLIMMFAFVGLMRHLVDSCTGDYVYRSGQFAAKRAKRLHDLLRSV